MRYFTAVLAVVLAGLALTQIGEPGEWLWIGAYGVGALLAGAASKRHLNLWTQRILAVASTLTMFLYLAGFFSRAPYLGEDWYAVAGNGGTLSLLLAGFCMMPVVSAFTCRLKSCAHTAAPAGEPRAAERKQHSGAAVNPRTRTA